MTKVIAIIPTFNSWRTLKTCLKSLLNQSAKIKKIIVVDNASSDGTSANVTKLFSQISLISLKTNTGVVGGRNAGLKSLPKDYSHVLFFDHDMVAETDMVKHLLNISSHYTDCGIATPKIYYLSNKKRIWSAGTGINLWTGQILFRGGLDQGQFDQIEEVQVSPAAMLIKKEVLKKVKLFDEKYFATYEDTDFCFRAKKYGYKTYYSPQAIAYHDLPTDVETESKRLLRRLYWVGRNRVLFMRDFGNHYLIFLMFLPVFAFYYLQLSLKYGNIEDFYSFIHGTIDGLRNK
jgi:GT2 family glycosyltransferase